MPSITFNQAKAFLDNISKNDSVAIIHDNDLDGFSSGIIYYTFCEKKAKKVKHFAIAYSDTDFDKLSIKNCNKIIITDIAPKPISKELEKIKKKDVLYVDHHQRDGEIPKEILEYRTLEEGYIPSARSAYELTKEKEWLSIAGTLADAGDKYSENDKFLSSFLNKEKITIEKYRSTVMRHLSNTIIYLVDDQNKAFEILNRLNNYTQAEKVLEKYSIPIDEEVKFWEKEYELKNERLGSINYFFLNPKFKIKTVVISILSNKYPEEVFVFSGPQGTDKISISTRNQSKKHDMIKLLKTCTNGFAINAGGHPAAAGGSIYVPDLEKFKENLKNYKF